MKFIILASTVLLAGTSAMAAMTPVPQDKVETYVRAMKEQIYTQASNFSCARGDISGVYDGFRKVVSVAVNDDHTQPVLTFNLVTDQNWRGTISVTTSPDFKKIVSITMEAWDLVNVNIGDLINPQYTNQWSAEGTIDDCKANN